ncbi:hypothetical protein Acr_00g0098120 [Actinidia rufa]|uniref:Uncharacterized protein n=1 Tax=Actinidia rufa TaxID=165716 RepID=A0A7J0E1L3_9ERIC|nr:hypothetical protein Acr_00g0098120 [Actinidia rufa]
MTEWRCFAQLKGSQILAYVFLWLKRKNITEMTCGAVSGSGWCRESVLGQVGSSVEKDEGKDKWRNGDGNGEPCAWPIASGHFWTQSGLQL